MLGSAKTNLPLLTLTSWVKGTSPFPYFFNFSLILKWNPPYFMLLCPYLTQNPVDKTHVHPLEKLISKDNLFQSPMFCPFPPLIRTQMCLLARNFVFAKLLLRQMYWTSSWRKIMTMMKMKEMIWWWGWSDHNNDDDDDDVITMIMLMKRRMMMLTKITIMMMMMMM